MKIMQMCVRMCEKYRTEDRTHEELCNRNLTKATPNTRMI